MDRSRPIYCASHNGRGAYSIAVTAFTAALALLFLFLPHWSMKLLGAALSAFALSGVYAILKGERWALKVEDGFISWSYDRWPKSTGRIDLSTVSHVEVDDCSAVLRFTFMDGRRQKLKLIGRGTPLKNHLKENFPGMTVEFVEGT